MKMKKRQRVRVLPSPFLLELQQIWILGALFGFGLAMVIWYNWQFGLLVAAAGFYFGYKKADEVERLWSPKH